MAQEHHAPVEKIGFINSTRTFETDPINTWILNLPFPVPEHIYWAQVLGALSGNAPAAPRGNARPPPATGPPACRPRSDPLHSSAASTSRPLFLFSPLLFCCCLYLQTLVCSLTCTSLPLLLLSLFLSNIVVPNLSLISSLCNARAASAPLFEWSF